MYINAYNHFFKDDFIYIYIEPFTLLNQFENSYLCSTLRCRRGEAASVPGLNIFRIAQGVPRG